MGLFGRSYDRDYGRDYGRGGIYGGSWDRSARSPGYRGGGADRGSAADDRDYYRSARGFVGGGYDTGYSNRYDRTFRSSGNDRYDRPYKGQWQRDHGDPFGDRQAGTPMRVIRGEYSTRDRGYDRGYSTRGGAYEPQRGRESAWERSWGMRDLDRSDRYGGDYRNWF